MDLFAKELKSGEVTEKDVKLMTAQQSNAAYGNINRELLDRNPTNQHLAQIFLLAPDFLEARGRFVGQALKGLVGQKSGVENLKAIAKIALIQAGTAYVATKIGGGTYDPKNPFAAQIGGRTYTMRSVPADALRLGGALFGRPQDTQEFVSARENPLMEKIGPRGEFWTGTNYRGEKISPADVLGETLANYIPITARWLPGVRELSATSRNSPISPLEQLAGSVGVKVSRYSPISKTYDLANAWMDSQKIDRPKGIYPTSKFTPMRYALEDADLGRAAAEYQKLLKTKGETPAKIARGFSESINHPFTGKKETEDQFIKSLKGDDKLMYDHAIETRKGILNKFSALPGVEATTIEEAPA